MNPPLNGCGARDVLAADNGSNIFFAILYSYGRICYLFEIRDEIFHIPIATNITLQGMNTK
jgi:hypothetical protein